MNAIDPQLLLTWARVARAGSLHVAAAELHLTQPAVSHQLRRLQEWMGEPLYRRASRGVVPTPTGVLLLRTAERLEAALEEAQALRSHTQSLLRGSLTLVASHSNAEYLLPPAIVAFRARYPGVSVRLTSTNSRQARALREGADLIFIEDTVSGADLGGDWEQRILVETGIALLVPRDHPFAHAGAPIPLASIDPDTLVWREEGSGIREHALQALQQQGIHPDIRYELSGFSAVRNALRCGLGISLVSALAGAEAHPDLCVVAVTPAIGHTLSALYRKGLSQAAQAFLPLLHAPEPMAMA